MLSQRTVCRANAIVAKAREIASFEGFHPDDTMVSCGRGSTLTPIWHAYRHEAEIMLGRAWNIRAS